MIEVKNLTKSYGATIAVNNVSFSAQAGEIVGFIGPNGAGKSTTMRVITCYLPADDGTVTVDGYDVFEESIEARKRIGYLPESNPLYTDMGVVDYLKFVAQVRGVSGHTRNERIKDVIDICSLEPMMHKNIGELSKGYRQRTGLAQAILHEPEVLILDEPTVGIDPIQVVETRQLIKELGQEQTLLLSTHILPEVSATCDRVIIINQGNIVAEDTPDNLAVRLRGTEQVQADIRGPSADVIKAIRDIPGVTSARHIETATGSRYNIESSSGNDIREAIATMVVSNSWGLQQLSVVPMSLEEIFLELTGGEENEDA